METKLLLEFKTLLIRLTEILIESEMQKLKSEEWVRKSFEKEEMEYKRKQIERDKAKAKLLKSKKRR